ncbi:MAG: hypothetical protein QM696_03440 [Steroidobacteraceae bacterium]
MSAFIAVAALLTLIAVAAIALPLLRPRSDSPPAVTLAVAASLVLAAAAALLYPLWSEWDWARPAAADSPAAMVGRLARRMERNPDDLPGWLQLGRSYSELQQFPLAARAYQRADQLAGGKNAEALMGLAESLVMGERSSLDGRAGRLFEQALQLDPSSNRALFYAAIAAMERGERPLARERFTRLLEVGKPPPEVRRLIEEQVRMLDAPAAQVVASAAPVSIPLRITLSGAMADKAAAGAPLFVLARVPGQPGPPLAALRLDAHFPQDVELRSSDAMIADRTFAAGQQLEIEARIANGGSAGSSTGDPFGSARVTAGDSQRVTIEIGQLKP